MRERDDIGSEPDSTATAAGSAEAELREQRAGRERAAAIMDLDARWREADILSLAARETFELALEEMRCLATDARVATPGAVKADLEAAVEGYATAARTLHRAACSFGSPSAGG